MKRFYPVLILIVVLTFMMVGCSQTTTATSAPAATSASVEATSAPTQASTDAASPTTAATLDGKNLLEARCVSCHTLARVASAKGDAAQWQQVVDLMVQKGAQLNADEEKVLVEYLAANFQ
ncbi:MAG: hypothetical protein VB013_01665 [Anaerolineaceae bacterium]|nr:hypothetical protein [Anaerolineaceae bacterium]